MAFTREDEIQFIKELEEANRIKEENMQREKERLEKREIVIPPTITPDTLRNLNKDVADLRAQYDRIINAVTENANKMQEAIDAFFETDGVYELMKRAQGTIANFVETNKDRFEILAGRPINDLLHSMIQHELIRFARNPENAENFPEIANSYFLDGSWIRTLLDNSFDENGAPIPTSPLMKVIRAAIDGAAMIEGIPATLEESKQTIERLEAERDSLPTEEEAEAIEQLANQIEQVSSGFTRWRAVQAEALDFPVDKVNNHLWKMIEESDPNGQLRFGFNMAKRGSKVPAVVLCGISFEETDPDLKISQKLTPFDKRVYVAVAALYNAGNEYMSITQIYKAMGGQSQPNSTIKKNISDSLTKMGMARVFIDSAEENKVNKNYPVFKYDAPLLPFERVCAYINNTMTEAAIHPFREPPMISFARSRNQLTTIKREVFEIPASLTRANITIADYLLEMISVMKRKATRKESFSRKLLLKTIYKECGITDTKQKQRAPGKIETCLKHYKKCSFISDYTLEKDSITIIL